MVVWRATEISSSCYKNDRGQNIWSREWVAQEYEPVKAKFPNPRWSADPGRKEVRDKRWKYEYYLLI